MEGSYSSRASINAMSPPAAALHTNETPMFFSQLLSNLKVVRKLMPSLTEIDAIV